MGGLVAVILDGPNQQFRIIDVLIPNVTMST
jgi:hypothetical protein